MRKGIVAVMFVAFAMMVVSALMADDQPKDMPMDKKTEPAGEAKWLDPENCYFCQPLVAEPGLMDHVHWETHPISNGLVDVVTVDPGFEDQYEKAHAAMMERWQSFNPADPKPTCGMCKAWIDAWDTSIKSEDVKTMHGHIGISTSDNPEVVAKMHAISERTTKEMAAYMEMGKEAHAH